MRRATVILYCICMLFTGCRGRNSQVFSPKGSSDYFIDLEQHVKGTLPDTFTVNTIAKNISFVPLETTKEALITMARLNLAPINGNYYIWDDRLLRTGIAEFDLEGRFVKYLITFGRGPNELPSIREFAYNHNRQQLVANSLYDMVIHSFESNSANKYIFDKANAYINLLNDGTIVSNVYGEGTDEPTLQFRNQEGDVVKSLYYSPTRDTFSDDSSEDRALGCRLYPAWNGDALFKASYGNTIHRICSMDDIRLYATLHCGDLTLTQKDAADSTLASKKIHIWNFFETPQYFFIKYIYRGTNHCAIWDKQRTTFIGRTEIDNSSIENRIIASNTAFTKYRTPKGNEIYVAISSYFDGKLYGMLSASDAMEFLPDIDEFDNPVIIIIELK